MKKFLFTLILIIILVFLAATALIGEIWQPGERNDYQYPQPQLVESTVFKVGESYQIPEILLGDNEKIDHVEVSDEDILLLQDWKVTALGQFFHSSVQVFTGEKEIEKKQPRYSDVVIFGHDFTAFLNNYRDFVRDLLHIEEHQPERTELRMLHIYEYDFEVSGLAESEISSQTVSSLYVDDSRDLTPELPANTFISSVLVSNPDLVSVRLKENGCTLTGLKEGDVRISFFISRYKSLNEEQYAAYCRYHQEKGTAYSPEPAKVEVLVEQIDCNLSVRQKQQESGSADSHEKVYFTTSKGYTGYTQNGVTYIEGLLVVNKTYSLPSTYGKGLTAQTTAAFNKMKEDAGKDGITLTIVSGFRSYSYQVDLYNRYVKNEGKDKADSHSARPGHSEHQAGLAMDLNSLAQSFDETPEFAWLQANAYKYGFIMRYPKNATASTGYIYEPWHYRYVGEQWAEIFYNGGNWITVEDYFGITSQYGN